MLHSWFARVVRGFVMTAVIDRQDRAAYTRQGSTKFWTTSVCCHLTKRRQWVTIQVMCFKSKDHPLPCQCDEPPGHSGTPHSRTPRPSAGPDSRELLHNSALRTLPPSPRRVRTPHRRAAGSIHSSPRLPALLLFGSKVVVVPCPSGRSDTDTGHPGRR